MSGSASRLSGWMKRLIVLVVAFTLGSAITVGEANPVKHDIFTHFPDICADDTLILSNQSFLKFRQEYFRSQSIRCVEVKHTVLDMIAGSFDALPNLMYLDLRENRIVISNPFSFGKLSNVSILKLGGMKSNNYYNKAVRIAIENEYPQLTYLDLSNIHIENMQILLQNPFPKLTHLDMSHSLPPEFIASFLPYVRTLTHLDLSNNGLSILNLFEMNRLLTLTLDGNVFESIGKRWHNDLSLQGCPKLTNLSLANNRIKYIDETAFENTTYLRYLNLSMNHFTAFNAGVLSSLHYLEVLVLDDNSLDMVPIDSHLNITTLSLNCNNIKNLTKNMFLYVPHLDKLYLNGNNIYFLPAQVFQNLDKLTELHLSDNALNYISTNIWSQLKNLKYLDLSGNAFTTLSHILDSTANLVEFSGNPLTYINMTELSAKSRNMLISFNDCSVPRIKLCHRQSNELEQSADIVIPSKK